jgi:hypothetical protein
VPVVRHFVRELSLSRVISCADLIWLTRTTCCSRGASGASCEVRVKMNDRVKLLLDAFGA